MMATEQSLDEMKELYNMLPRWDPQREDLRKRLVEAGVRFDKRTGDAL